MSGALIKQPVEIFSPAGNHFSKYTFSTDSLAIICRE